MSTNELIPPTPALSSVASSPLQEPAPSTPVPPATTIESTNSPLTSTLTFIVEMSKQKNYNDISKLSIESEAMYATINPNDELWQYIYEFSIFSDLIINDPLSLEYISCILLITNE